MQTADCGGWHKGSERRIHDLKSRLNEFEF
jgi:hypothetical protein